MHQTTNYVPIPGMLVPQARQMTNHPTPVTRPIVQHNPLVNPLRDLTSGNKQIEDELLSLKANSKPMPKNILSKWLNMIQIQNMK